MLNIKKALTKLSLALYTPVTIRNWSGKATPASQYYDMVTQELPANTRHLIVFGGGNGISTASKNRLTAASDDNPPGFQTNSVMANAGSGNHSVGWAYVKTGSSSATVAIRMYGYDTTVTNASGSAVFIRLPGY